jgi:hypothetical protein
MVLVAEEVMKPSRFTEQQNPAGAGSGRSDGQCLPQAWDQQRDLYNGRRPASIRTLTDANLIDAYGIKVVRGSHDRVPFVLPWAPSGPTGAPAQ